MTNLTVKEIFDSWQNGELYDAEAICQITACPPRPRQYIADAMAEQIEAIAKIARSEQKIIAARTREQFVTWIGERFAIPGINTEVTDETIKVLLAAWDRGEIVWRPGQFSFTFVKKGE